MISLIEMKNFFSQFLSRKLVDSKVKFDRAVLKIEFIVHNQATNRYLKRHNDANEPRL